MSNTRLYNIWRGIKKRCGLPTAHAYENYGGRGICVCAEWRESFEAFRDWALANGYRDDLTLDRIDNDRGYEPSNCRWVSWVVQENNKRNLLGKSGVKEKIDGELSVLRQQKYLRRKIAEAENKEQMTLEEVTAR